jgi:hypothetical protein
LRTRGGALARSASGLEKKPATTRKFLASASIPSSGTTLPHSPMRSDSVIGEFTATARPGVRGLGVVLDHLMVKIVRTIDRKVIKGRPLATGDWHCRRSSRVLAADLRQRAGEIDAAEIEQVAGRKRAAGVEEIRPVLARIFQVKKARTELHRLHHAFPRSACSHLGTWA